MIPNLSLCAFKGVTAEYELAKGNLVLGANFSGKTAIDQAIRCLALGYIPGVSKTSAGLKMFASDYPMRVAATLADGTSLGVAFERVRSTVKQTEDNTLKADEATRVLFDPDIFFGLPDAARIRKAFELVRSKAGNRDEIVETVKALLDTTPALKPEFNRWLFEVVEGAGTVNDLLSASETFWKAQKKTATEEKERQQKMVEGLADVSTVEAELARLPSRAEAEESKRRLYAEVDKLTAKIAGAVASNTAATQRAARLADLHARTANAAAVYAEAKQKEAEVERLEKEVAELQRTADTLRSEYSAAVATSRAVTHVNGRIAQCEAIVANTAQIEAELERMPEVLANAADAVEEAKDSLAAAENAVAAAEAEQRQRDETAVFDGVDMRTIGFDQAEPGLYMVTGIVERTVDGESVIREVRSWAPHTEMTDEQAEAAQSAEFEAAQRVAELKDAVTAAAGLVIERKKEYDAVSQQMAKLEQDLATCRHAVVELTEIRAKGNVQPLTAEQIAELSQRLEAALLALAARRSDLSAHRDAWKVANQKATETRAAEKELSETLALPAAPLTTAEEMAKLQADRATASAAYTAAETTVHAIIAFEQDRIRIQQAAEKRAEIEATIKTIGEVLKLLTEKKTEIVSESIEAPLATANKLAAGILKGALTFEEGELGMRVGTKFVSSRVFSGTESAIVMMGLTAGLAAKSKLRVLLLDEIGRLDAANACRLIANLGQMLKDGDIDQYILIGPENPYLTDTLKKQGVNGYKLIEV